MLGVPYLEIQKEGELNYSFEPLDFHAIPIKEAEVNVVLVEDLLLLPLSFAF